MPDDCGTCRPVDLAPENRDAWQLANRFRSMIRKGPDGRLFVDYAAARTVAELTRQPDPLFFLDCIEAVKNGLTDP